jgi:hypothetical protein
MSPGARPPEGVPWRGPLLGVPRGSHGGDHLGVPWRVRPRGSTVVSSRFGLLKWFPKKWFPRGSRKTWSPRGDPQEHDSQRGVPRKGFLGRRSPEGVPKRSLTEGSHGGSHVEETERGPTQGITWWVLRRRSLQWVP